MPKNSDFSSDMEVKLPKETNKAQAQPIKDKSESVDT